jgi:hypothetical protein
LNEPITRRGFRYSRVIILRNEENHEESHLAEPDHTWDSSRRTRIKRMAAGLQTLIGIEMFLDIRTSPVTVALGGVM